MEHQQVRLFDLGRILITASVQHLIENEVITNAGIFEILRRHSKGDWGSLAEDDKQENQLALREGFRLLSAYTLGETKLWIITEADRSATTVLLPSDY